MQRKDSPLASAHATSPSGPTKPTPMPTPMPVAGSGRARKASGKRTLHTSHASRTSGIFATREADAELEIRRLFEAWWRASEAKDLEASMKPIADDVVSFEHGGPLVHHGKDEVREVCAKGYQSTRGDFRWDVPELHVEVQGDLAVAWGLDRMAEQGEGAAPPLWGRGTRVFRKRDGRWQMIHQHVSFPYDEKSGKARLDLEPPPKL